MSAISLPGQLARTRLFTSGVPERFTVAADGATVLFLRSRGGDDSAACLWALDARSGEEWLLAGPGDRGGIAGYATDAEGALAAFSLDGRLWLVDAAGGPPRALPAKEPVSDPRPDPAGRRIAYVRDGALRVIGADGSGDRELAAPDGHAVTFGVADYTADAGPDGARGFWWSPDGERLLVKRVDSADVPLWHIADPSDPAGPPRTRRYPAAGAAVAEVTLWIVDLDGTRFEAAPEAREFAYLPRADWNASGPQAVVLSRDQHTARLLGLDPDGGAAEVLCELRDDCWVQPVSGLPARTAAGAVLSYVDEGGTRRLTVDGVPVTPPGLQLRSLLGVDGGEVLFAASEDPVETHLWSHRADRGVRRLTGEPGVHTGVLRGATLVHTARTADAPGVRVRVLRVGAPDAEIASLAERPVLGLRVERLLLGPRDLRAALYLPSWHRPGGARLPVLVDSYGGAGAQRVTAQQDASMFVSQWFAEQGFAVLAVDGSGTPGRGPEWEREVRGDIYRTVLDDQVAAVREAIRLRPDLDPERIGIRGWSFGGSLAAVAVLRRPDVFRVAVAGAGPTDQRLYNAPWRERFLGHPDEHPEWYEAGSLLRDAPRLTRPLLLVHGLADDNVFPVHTLRLSDALTAAGRPHEVLLLAGAGHRPLATPVAEPLLTHQRDFLRRHLTP